MTEKKMNKYQQAFHIENFYRRIEDKYSGEDKEFCITRTSLFITGVKKKDGWIRWRIFWFNGKIQWKFKKFLSKSISIILYNLQKHNL